MIIFLDTTSQKNYTIAIFSKDQKLIVDKVFISKNRSENILGNLDRLLNQNYLQKSDIKYIAVNIGPKNLKGEPASFTGVRIGAAIVNSLNLSLSIKVIKIENDQISQLNQIYQQIWKKYCKKEFSDFILPNYHHGPNITKRKSKIQMSNIPEKNPSDFNGAGK